MSFISHLTKFTFVTAILATLAGSTSLGWCKIQEESEKTEQKKESSDSDQDEEKQDDDSSDEKQDKEAKQENKGQKDLDAAFDTRATAQSTRDFDKVCDLCKSAIEKGLNEDAESQAKELWTSTLLEHAEQLAQRILPPNTDRRWKLYRREALVRLDEAIKIDPEALDAYILLARMSTLPGGDRAAGKKAVIKAVELSGDKIDKLSESLVLRGALGDDDQSRLADFNQAVKIDPSNVEAIRSRAAQYLRMNDVAKAIEDFQLWIENDAKNVQAYFGIVQALMSEERFEEAVEYLGKAIEINPEAYEPYSLRSRLNLQLDKFDAAFDDAQQALKGNQNDIEALMVRASVYTERQEYQSALDDVDRVLKSQPGLVRGIWMRSILSGQLEKYDQAIEDIQLLIENDPRQPQFKTQLAMLYNAADQPEEAVKIYDDLIEDDSENADALRGRGDAFLSLSKHKKAIADYEEALEIDPELDGVLNNLAWVLATSPDDEVRDGERAVKLASQAAELTEYKQAHILSTLASGYAESGDFEKAKEWIGKALEISDDKEQISNLKKEMASYEKGEAWREDQLKELKEKREKKESDDEDSKKDDDN